MINNRDLVQKYLEAMQTSDLAAVHSLSEPGALLEYPGGRRFESPDSLFSWAKWRHRWISHNLQDVDCVSSGQDTLIYASGTLEGVWTDGKAFSGIRFIYRFVTRGERFLETRLWSDVAESLRSPNPAP